MLRIILGSDYAEQQLGIKNIAYGLEDVFKAAKQKEWFSDELVREIISKIDNADVIADYSIYSREYKTGYSVDTLSSGTMSLILAYKMPDFRFSLRMGDNCTDFLEKIAAYHEKNGRDLVVITNYMHMFNFKYIDKIEYINWGIICNNKKDIVNNIMSRWYEQEDPDYNKDKSEDE